MNASRDSKRELESANELVNSELECESADELESRHESILKMTSDGEMDEDIVIGDDNAVNADSGSSTTYEPANKIAKKDLVDSNGSEKDMNIGGSTRRLRNSDKKAKKACEDTDEIVGDHWSPEEKALLLASMKQYGMLNMPRLASILKTKNVRQIKDLIAKVAKSVYAERKINAQERALERLANQQTANPRGRSEQNGVLGRITKTKRYKNLFAQEMGEGPIEWWLRYMENTLIQERKRTKKIDMASNPRTVSELIPRACLLISQYENHPLPSTCGGVNYEEAYECLYHVLSGVPPKALSPPTAMFIQRSMDRLRKSILDGMYKPEYSKYFGEQVSHIQMASKEIKAPPKRTYVTAPKKLGPVMAQGIGLPSPSKSVERLMAMPGFNLMRVPESLTWRKCFAPFLDKPARKERCVIQNDIPFGLFCDTDIYEGIGPSTTTN